MFLLIDFMMLVFLRKLFLEMMLGASAPPRWSSKQPVSPFLRTWNNMVSIMIHWYTYALRIVHLHWWKVSLNRNSPFKCWKLTYLFFMDFPNHLSTMWSVCVSAAVETLTCFQSHTWHTRNAKRRSRNAPTSPVSRTLGSDPDRTFRGSVVIRIYHPQPPQPGKMPSISKCKTELKHPKFMVYQCL